MAPMSAAVCPQCQTIDTVMIVEDGVDGVWSCRVCDNTFTRGLRVAAVEQPQRAGIVAAVLLLLLGVVVISFVMAQTGRWRP